MCTILEFPLIGRPIFAYPNDGIVKGSRDAFTALHASMVRKRVVGIGKLLHRIAGVARMVAIIPQEETLFEDGEQEKPPGFIIVPLAFEDDIRAIPNNGDLVADSNLVQVAENMIRNLNLDDDIVLGESFENPALKIFWNYVESVALGTPLPNTTKNYDDTTWDIESIMSSCAQHIDTFRNLLPHDTSMEVVKKRKTGLSETEVGDINWIQEFNQNTLEYLPIDKLKMYLRSQGERITGRKADLVARIKMHISSALQHKEL